MLYANHVYPSLLVNFATPEPGSVKGNYIGYLQEVHGMSNIDFY